MRAAFLSGLLFAAACAPQLNGECLSDDTCPLDTRCIGGLCLAGDASEFDAGGFDAGITDAGSADAGTTDGCPSPCPEGFHCTEQRECAPVSRDVWRWAPTHGAPITAAPAIVGPFVVFGDEAGVVTALHRDDGSLAWQVQLDAAIVGHLAGATDADELTVYAVTRDGHAYWIDAAAPPDSTDRVLFQCPETGGREPASGPSVAAVPAAARHDTLFVVSRDGTLQVMQRPAAGDDEATCLHEHASAAAEGGSAPSLSPHGKDVSAYVAAPEGDIRRIDVTFEEDGPRFEEAWVKSGAGTRGAPALGQVDDQEALVVGTEESRLRALDAMGTGWPLNAKLVGAAIVGSPALVGGDAYVIDQLGEGQRVNVADGKKQWTPAFQGPARSVSAAAGPVVGADGRVFLVTGATASSLTDKGVVEWAFIESGATLDTVTPALDCEGRLFLAANTSTTGALIAVDTGSPGLAAGWPRPGHDARNTSNTATVDAQGCVD